MHVLLVDDEAVLQDEFVAGNYMWYYINAVRMGGHVVTVVNCTDRALQVLSETARQVDCMILDVIMPGGRWVEDPKTLNQGTRTGLVFAKYLYERYPALPILVLTHVDDAEICGELEALENVREVIRKHECLPYELLAKVDAI